MQFNRLKIRIYYPFPNSLSFFTIIIHSFIYLRVLRQRELPSPF